MMRQNQSLGFVARAPSGHQAIPQNAGLLLDIARREFFFRPQSHLFQAKHLAGIGHGFGLPSRLGAQPMVDGEDAKLRRVF